MSAMLSGEGSVYVLNSLFIQFECGVVDWETDTAELVEITSSFMTLETAVEKIISPQGRCSICFDCITRLSSAAGDAQSSRHCLNLSSSLLAQVPTKPW